MKEIKDMTIEEVIEEHRVCYRDVGGGCSRHCLNRLLELERELTLRKDNRNEREKG